MKLEAKIWAQTMVFDPMALRVEHDASPYGGAAILFEEGQATEYFTVVWQDISRLGVKTGESKHQTFWECLTLVLAAVKWRPLYSSLLFCGDNMASLSLAISGKS